MGHGAAWCLDNGLLQTTTSAPRTDYRTYSGKQKFMEQCLLYSVFLPCSRLPFRLDPSPKCGASCWGRGITCGECVSASGAEKGAGTQTLQRQGLSSSLSRSLAVLSLRRVSYRHCAKRSRVRARQRYKVEKRQHRWRGGRPLLRSGGWCGVPKHQKVGDARGANRRGRDDAGPPIPPFRSGHRQRRGVRSSSRTILRLSLVPSFWSPRRG